MRALFGHEITHRIQELAPEEYRAFRQAALADTRFLDERVEAMRQLSGEHGVELDNLGAMDELAADYAGRLMENGQFLERFIQNQRGNRSVLERVRDVFRGLVERLTGKYQTQARQAERRLTKALEAAGEQTKLLAGQKNSARVGAAVRYYIDPGFTKAIEQWDGKSRQTFRLGRTSQALQSIGVADRGIILHGAKLAHILSKHSGMTLDVVKQIPNILEHPIAILASRQSGTRLAIFGEVTDANGAPVTAVLELQPTTKGGELLDLNVLVSAYGKDTNPSGFIQNSGLLYLDSDKTRTENWMQSVGLQLPSDATAFGSIGSISYQDGSVKIDAVPWQQYMRSSGENTVHNGAVEAAAKEADNLAGQRQDTRDTMRTTKFSLKEDEESGGQREETRNEFLRRSHQEGYEIFEGTSEIYGFRRVEQPNDGGARGEATRSAQAREELSQLGINADIIDGIILRNRDGITLTRVVQQAVTVDTARIFLNESATLPPRNIAGHEAFHLWKGVSGRSAYIEAIEDNLDFTSTAFQEYQSSISQAMFGQEADLSDPRAMDRFTEELFAYISGDLHEGVNDDILRPMFRDYDAVKAAWEELVESQQGQNPDETQTARFSLKEDGQHGQAREESGERFRERIQEEGYSLVEGDTTAYGLRSVHGGSSGKNARSVQKELTLLGVPSQIKEGPVLRNRDGRTTERRGPQAVTLGGVVVAVDNNISIPAKNAAGHEAFHFWGGQEARESFTAVLEDNLLFGSMEFQHYQTVIAETVFGDEVDLTDTKTAAQFKEEIFAYLSGDIHEGINDASLRPMFRDYDAVKAAWEELVESQQGQNPDETQTARFSLKEDMENGATREETRGAFLRGAVGAGYAVYEGKTAAYAYRRLAGQSARDNARQVQEEVIRLGIDADIIEGGTILRNYNGATYSRVVPQAATIDRGRIIINNTATISPRNIAGHEAFHLWKDVAGRSAYIEAIEDNIDFTSTAFRDYQSSISQAIFGKEADLFNLQQMERFREELFAYLSGDIHEGINDASLRPMFRDYDAVKAAWEELVESQSKEGAADFSLKGSEQLGREIDRVMRRARETGRGQADVQAEIRALVEEVYQQQVDQYGAMKPGERAARTVQVPRKTAGDRKVSQTVRTVLEAGATPEEAVPTIQELTARGEFSYQVIADKQAIERAQASIQEKGYAGALLDWTDKVRGGNVTKENTALGWALYNQAASSGDMKTAMAVLTNMVAHQRNAAQAVQATRILKQMGPQAQLYGAQRSVKNLQEELTSRYGDRAPNLKIDEQLAEEVLRANDQRERDRAMQALYRDIGRQMPARFADKWNAWRYLAMLGNPRTHVRNVVGNAGFMPVVLLKDTVAVGLEAAADRVSGGKLERSKALVGLGKRDRALVKAAWGDYVNVQEQALGSGKYSDGALANQSIQQGRRIFQNRVLEGARRANSAALDAEDIWFSKPHYAAALAQYCKANHITVEQIAAGRGAALERARAYAVKEAQRATYRDTNAFSQMVSELGRYGGQNPVKRGASLVMEGILPFRKTPANILVRGLEYSPAGLLRGLTYDLGKVKRGEMTASQAIDDISAGLTGTGLVALGVYLAAEGLVRGAGGDDDKKKEFERLQGHQAYALELPGGTSVTLDWLAPEALPFFVGVNLYEQARGGAEQVSMSDLLQAASTVTEPLLEMSCLQSLNDVFDAVGYAASDGLDALPAALASSATSYLTQAAPTLLGQFERAAEGERMTTYTTENTWLTPDMQYTLGRVSARIPGWDYSQIPYIDAWGRRQDSGGVVRRTVGNFLNPAYTANIETSPMELELQRLYEATGESGVLPNRADKRIRVNGENRPLSAQDYVSYAEERGQFARRVLSELTASPSYAALEDTDRAGLVRDVYVYADAAAKMLVSDYRPDGWVAKAMETVRSTGLSEAQYLTLYLDKGKVESLKDSNGETIPNSKSLLVMQMLYQVKGLTDKQRQALFQDFGVGKSVIHYNKTLVEEKLREMARTAQ